MMPINKEIIKILDTGIIYDNNEKPHNISDTSIDIDEAIFLFNSISENNISQTIEIGCAYGLSSLVICDALSNKVDAYHTIIDPFQSSQWGDIGRYNLNKFGFTNYEIIEDKSELALPALLSRGKKIDFAFIDGWHTFDHTLIDFFYINRMLNQEGIILFDDANWPSISKLIKYILNYPSYDIIYPNSSNNIRTKTKNYIKKSILRINSLLPDRVTDSILIKDSKSSYINTNSRFVCLKKTSDDDRDWKWFVDF